MPSNPGSSVPSPRTRTPSDLKWLLNERAALAGRLQLQQAVIADQQARFFAAQAALEEVAKKLEERHRQAADTAARIDALDRTMSLGYPGVYPGAAGSVKAHSRFGTRGAFIGFLLDQVTEARGTGVTTGELVDRVSARFGLPTATSKERESVRWTTYARMRQLRDKHGLVTSQRTRTAINYDTVWRPVAAPALAELQRQAWALDALPTEAPDDAPPHPDAL